MNQFRIQAESANPRTRIKNEARRRIVNVVGPGWKQQNIQARAAELHLKETRGVINTEESDELQGILNLWGWVKSVRAASDSLEVSLPANYKDDSHWPAVPD
ncbi:MAG: hypothetical protein G3M70_06050 [Candidatus Nitronauta litoralis]|uniref:Uncharacterized protein n=1 Tax=Candidatus Nitronauta litoralis TaxID=2705533 RepID=A0A7T0BUY2_9BACT|nr:MAG: hypothetical protein G3M70_06050 [Candidatus Nitronauta litoralis]